MASAISTGLPLNPVSPPPGEAPTVATRPPATELPVGTPRMTRCQHITLALMLLASITLLVFTILALTTMPALLPAIALIAKILFVGGLIGGGVYECTRTPQHHTGPR